MTNEIHNLKTEYEKDLKELKGNKFLYFLQERWLDVYFFMVRHFDLYNWIRFRTWDKYHVLKMRYIKPGYADAVEILPHAMFEVLCQFIEKEKPDEIVNWDSDPEHKHAWDEMQSLYKWWTEERPKRDKLDPLFQPGVNSPTMDFNSEPESEGEYHRLNFIHKSKEEEEKWNKACIDSSEFEKKCNEEDENNMIRLVKIRHFLWT